MSSTVMMRKIKDVPSGRLEDLRDDVLDVGAAAAGKQGFKLQSAWSEAQEEFRRRVPLLAERRAVVNQLLQGSEVTGEKGAGSEGGVGGQQERVDGGGCEGESESAPAPAAHGGGGGAGTTAS